MKLLFIIFLLLSAVTIVSSALGLKTLYECETDPTINRESLKMKCYHTAAMTSAYIGDVDRAKIICETIFTSFGSTDVDGSDLTKVAEVESNACYYDVAKIARDPEICEAISQQINLQSQLFGAEVTQENCLNQVCRLAQIVPQNYYGTAPPSTAYSALCPPITATNESICNVLFFILPLFLGVWKYS
ncbi:MAG: hypothetical protein ABID61_06135 [Candidatus Micrarchaeota archaeon]